MGKHLLVIGGVAAGTRAAARARRLDPSLDITIITDEPFISYSGCGLPYFIGGLVKKTDELIHYTPEKFGERTRAQVLVRHRALNIDAKKKTVQVQNLDSSEEISLNYDVLLLATGARPLKPPLEGIDLGRIFTLRNPDDAEQIRNTLEASDVRRAVIAGAGLIGMELAENLLTHQLEEVTVVEMLPQLLPQLDEDMAWLVEEHLVKHGIRVLKNDPVRGFLNSDGKNVGMVLTEHTRIEADIAILTLGAKPNVELAQSAGIELGETGAIKVDETMRTSVADIFAAGDCVETHHRIANAPVHAPFGSVANRQGRVAGSTIAGEKDSFPGVVGAMITRVVELTVGKTGLNEKEARRCGIPYVRAIFQARPCAGYFPESSPMWLKILAEKETQRLLGLQIVGRYGVDKRLDTFSALLTHGGKVSDLREFDVAYVPPLSLAIDALNTAGQILEGLFAEPLTTYSVVEVHEQLQNRPEEVALLDVRTPREKARTGSLPEAVHIPMSELKERANELPKDKEIIIFDTAGELALRATRTLQKLGFGKVVPLDGGISLWPYERV